jgi:hypothetical protein
MFLLPIEDSCHIHRLYEEHCHIHPSSCMRWNDQDCCNVGGRGCVGTRSAEQRICPVKQVCSGLLRLVASRYVYSML